MKKVEYVFYKNEDGEELTNCKVSDVTYYDIHTNGTIAKRNLKNQLKKCIWGDIKDVKALVINGQYIEVEFN